MNYYRRWLGSYKKKTADLSLMEHGVYTLLLDHYYATEKPLPSEVTRLSRICGAITHDEQRAVAHVADTFFPVATDGSRHNERADEELGIAQATIQKQREGGIETADKRWGKDRLTDDEPERSTKAAAHKSTKTKTRKSTIATKDRTTDSSTTRSTNALPIQPTTNNLQPTSDTRQPTGETTSLVTNRDPAPARAKPNGEHPGSASASPPDVGSEQPRPRFASDGEIPWWHSPAGIQNAGIERGIYVEPDEDFGEFKARVMAKAGPGPWDQEQPPEVFERIEFYRATGGVA